MIAKGVVTGKEKVKAEVKIKTSGKGKDRNLTI